MKGMAFDMSREARAINRIWAFAGNTFLILAAVHCTMGALISAFSLKVDVRMIYPVWVAAALALSALATLWRGKGLLLLMPVVLFLLFRNLSDITDGAKWAIFHITTEYSRWLHVPVFFSGAVEARVASNQFFSAAGVALACLLSLAVCLRRSAALTAFFTAPIVFLTFILVETRPDDPYLIGLLAVYLTMLICSSLQPNDFIKRIKAVFPSLLAASLVLGTAYLLAQPGNFSRSYFIGDVDNQIRGIVERAGLAINKIGFGWPDITSGEWRFNTDRVSVSEAGPRRISDKSILVINASHTGTYYLRGYSMQSFDGRDWHGNDGLPSFEYMSQGFPPACMDAYSRAFPASAPETRKMAIANTGDYSGIIYQPYYSFPLQDADPEAPYAVDFYYTDESVLSFYKALEAANTLVPSNFISIYDGWMSFDKSFTQIDESTAAALKRIAINAGIDPDADRAEIADAVAEFILSSGRYTLSPYVIPADEDFAVHFLQVSKRGYCIHFATVATLMLRALDVPARFTSGFLVTVNDGYAGRSVVVTDRNAHAWVEVYYPYLGWLPLEVTPVSEGTGTPGTAQHTVPDFPEDRPGYSGDPFDDMFPDDWFDDFERPTPGQSSPRPEPGEDGSGLQGSAVISREAGAFLICVGALAIIIASRWFLAGLFRKRKFMQEDANEAAILVWRYVSRLDRRIRHPEDIEAIALKARFSQHRISEDERLVMVSYATTFATVTYRRKSISGKIWLFIRGL